LAVLAVFVTLSVVNAVRRRAAKSGGHRERAAPAPLDAAPVPLAEHERLARAGRFDEACHLVLLAALARLATRRKEPFAPSATGREILWTLDGAPREGLEVLVRIVERSLFAGQPATEDDYAAAVSALTRFEASS
jgi:hypothetical protein